MATVSHLGPALAAARPGSGVAQEPALAAVLVGTSRADDGAAPRLPHPHARQPQVLHVVPWQDPLVDAVGVDPRSCYVELFWLPVLGPSATWLLRLLARLLDAAPDGIGLDPLGAARCLGIGGPRSGGAPIERALARCIRFGMARYERSGALAVRRRVARVPSHALARLPDALKEQHRRWEEAPADPAEARRRARGLAADLAALGDGASAAERRLLRFGVHPALAYDAARWAASLAMDLPTAP